MDPHAVLGVEPGASPEEVTAAYRRLAKAHHPDSNGSEGQRIRDINAAYAMLRDSVAISTRQPRSRGRRRPGAAASRLGDWLPPAVRLALGAELLQALQPREAVQLIATASSWDAHDVRLVLTDRRLVWLRDDALTDRVRHVKLADVDSVAARRGRLGRTGELRVRVREGRLLDFADLRPETLTTLERSLQPQRAGADH